ncbi:cyclase family protein [Arthrobacter sp. 92]|uniref:cyclase family protein n=1 Tax=Arthrobacter sp. 92 TaxID=3418175 RepID=UPI003CFBFE1E
MNRIITSQVVDLTRPITNGMEAHITTSVVPLLRIGEASGRFDPPCEGFAANVLVMSDHCGTHLDAPSHFIRDGAGVDEISVANLVLPAVVLDLSECQGRLVQTQDLEAAVAALGTPPRAGEAVLLNTRHSDGTGRGLDRGAAEWLVATGVVAVGTDHMGIDDPGTRDSAAHMVLLGAGIPIVENLTDVETIRGRRFLFIALPLRIEGGTGSPVRAVAVLENLLEERV